MKFKWLKLRDRVIRLDRVHEFWIEKDENGDFLVYAGVFGSPNVLIERFSTYSEAENFINGLSRAIVQKKLIDVEEILYFFDDEEDDDIFS